MVISCRNDDPQKPASLTLSPRCLNQQNFASLFLAFASDSVMSLQEPLTVAVADGGRSVDRARASGGAVVAARLADRRLVPDSLA